MKLFLRITICWLLPLLILSFFDFLFPTDFFDVMFTIIGILFSIAISQILSFSFSDISNDVFVGYFRKNLTSILISFFLFFIISIFVFVLKDIKFKFRVKICSFSINNLFAIFDIYCLIYFSNNFFHLFKLKNDIDDLIRKEK